MGKFLKLEEWPTMNPQPPEISRTLRAEPGSVALARETVRETLLGWGYDRDVVHDAVVVTSEIVNNAVAAAPGDTIRLRCAVHDDSPLLECWDPAPTWPIPRTSSETSENGRGLAIIAAYAKDTGVRSSPTGHGKVVWALMAT